MKKTVSCFLIALMAFMTLSCGKQVKQTGPDMDTDEDFASSASGGIVLTQAILDTYMETLPPFIKKAKAEGENIESAGAGWAFGAEMISLLEDHGWATPEEFLEVHTKVWTITPWLIATAKMKDQPTEMQEMFLKQYEALFEAGGMTEAEKELLVANKDKLIAALEEADK
ncbi:MAG: hypothetical protein JW881_13750 [Spirochaetales bacterium]|nr:hypothetical protein [Spirochaetales bacterium]